MTLSANDILNVKDTSTIEVEVSEWGGSVCVRELSVGDMELYRSYAIKNADTAQPNLIAYLAHLVLCDEHGNRLFDDLESVHELAKKSQSAMNKVIEKANELNGFGDDAVEQEAKN